MKYDWLWLVTTCTLYWIWWTLIEAHTYNVGVGLTIQLCNSTLFSNHLASFTPIWSDHSHNEMPSMFAFIMTNLKWIDAYTHTSLLQQLEWGYYFMSVVLWVSANIRTKFLHCFFQKHDRNSGCNFVSWVCSKFLVKVCFILMCTHFPELIKSAGSHGNSVTTIHDEGDDYLTLLWVTLIRLCKPENLLSDTAQEWDTNEIFIKEKTSFKGIHVGNMVWCNATIMLSIFLTNYKYAKPPLWSALAFQDMQWEEPDLWCWLAHNTV